MKNNTMQKLIEEHREEIAEKMCKCFRKVIENGRQSAFLIYLRHDASGKMVADAIEYAAGDHCTHAPEADCIDLWEVNADKYPEDDDENGENEAFYNEHVNEELDRKLYGNAKR